MFQHTTFWLLLAVAVPAFWALPPRMRSGFLFAVSFGYLATIDLFSVSAMLAWTLLFFFALRFAARSSRLTGIATVLVLAITGFFAYFKYLRPLLGGAAGHTAAAVVLVPLGISYFTFKLIHYTIETVRGNIREPSLATFLSYVFLFPIFTAGPIQRFDTFLEGRQAAWSTELLVHGLTRICYGLIKRFVLLELLLLGVLGAPLPMGPELAHVVPETGAAEAWGLLFATYLFIYLDFSAYTDLAIGCSRLFGLKIMENFHFPFLARDISDFWRRWHISLSAWCQSYIYLPIMGLTRTPYVAALGSFLVIGLWHAASPVRLAWALFHFAGVAAFMTWTRRRGRRRRRSESTWARLGGVVATQAFVAMSMAFLLAEGSGLGTGLRLLARLIPHPTGP